MLTVSLKATNITQFLESRGWTISSQSNNFISYAPPFALNLPNGYLFQVPKDETREGFQEFCQRIISILVDIYEDEFTEDDLAIIFSSRNSVLYFRIADSDTQKGSIKLSRVKLSVEGLYKILQQTVTFISTGNSIFGNAKKEVSQYINSCRYLQTQKGSFVTKIELPTISVNIFDNTLVPDKLFNVLEFIAREGTTKKISELDENYVVQHSDLINVELYFAIYTILKDAKISSANMSLLTQNETKNFDISRISKKLSHFNQYTKKIKEILLRDVPLEIKGLIYNLNSSDPHKGGEIIMQTEIANKKEVVKVRLSRKHYEGLAVNAHGNKMEVRVKGIARLSNGKNYYIENVDEFGLAT